MRVHTHTHIVSLTFATLQHLCCPPSQRHGTPGDLFLSQSIRSPPCRISYFSSTCLLPSPHLWGPSVSTSVEHHNHLTGGPPPPSECCWDKYVDILKFPKRVLWDPQSMEVILCSTQKWDLYLFCRLSMPSWIPTQYSCARMSYREFHEDSIFTFCPILLGLRQYSMRAWARKKAK